MRILHTADWHIGKSLAGFDLLDVQRRSFAQLCQVVRDQHVDAMIIAGDVYDRSLAAENVVDTVNDMLRTLNLDDKLPLLVISGNHDSAPRLATGHEWFANTGLYLNTTIAGAFKPVTIGDTQFFLLPYFEPRQAQVYFGNDSLTSIGASVARVIDGLVPLFEEGKHHVLVSHFFVAGSSHVGTNGGSSETSVSVGGLDAVPVDIFAPFDYVALGHLHNRHALNAEKIQYAGSLVKYDVSEANMKKGCYILDTDTMVRKFIEIPQTPEFRHVTDSFDRIMDPDTDLGVAPDDYVQFTLTDTEVIPDLMNRLRERFPHCTGVDRATSVDLQQEMHAQIQDLDPMALLTDFYADALGSPLSDGSRKWAEKTLAEVRGEH
ncbi:exonuclease SbcCD subunit D [Lacticaseibacillus hulanensis]|uniref:exonuclease SbcCD subunit D n=1 Tax=Lacticaseibacillus hulanensis TaxID=2493111 RepID=UPI000FD6C608|nr:exonuclease SbcCD subunit D [Lacticaseibacillus hulanensis]